MRSIAAAVLIVAGMTATAHAGRSYYGWLYGVEVLPERSVELQTWVLERDNLGDAHRKVTSWWIGPLVGVTDQLELAFPVETRWLVADGMNPSYTFERYGAELRYRFVTQDPVDAPAFAPLGRLAVKRDVTSRDATVLEADLVAAYESGRFHALADAGFFGEISGDRGNHFEMRPGAGISIRAVEDLRFGVEGYGEISMDSAGDTWFAAGPNLAWTHGRFWLSAAYGIGITGIKAAPRFMWGVLF